MKMQLGVLLLGLLLPYGAMASRGRDADVCYSKPSKSMAYHLTSETVLRCSRAGNHTLYELAKAGWRIITVASVVMGNGQENGWMVVIEK